MVDARVDLEYFEKIPGKRLAMSSGTFSWVYTTADMCVDGYIRRR